VAYMRNVDTRAKVGFRPYYQTDPFGAAHLSGYGSGLGRPQNPFMEEAWTLQPVPPWRLQGLPTEPTEAGLGRYFYNRPFDASGWELYSETDPTLHGLDLYAPSRFAVPTASSQRLQAGGNNPGGGTILLGGVDGSVWALQGVSLKDEIDHVRDEIAALVERARQAAGRGDTITSRTLVNNASAAAGTLQGLGNVPDQNTVAELEANGWDSGEVQTLVAMGASDEQLLALPYPASLDEMSAAFSALMAELTSTKQAVRVSHGPAPAPQPAATQPANRAPAPFLAAGTRLTYIAQWAGGAVIDSPATIASKIKPILSSTWGIEIDGESDGAGFFYTSSPGFTLQVHTTRDYGQASDIQHIIDGVVTNAGRSVVASQIGVTMQNATGPGLLNPPGGAPNFTQWFESNWQWLALGLGAVVVAGPIAGGIFGGRRR